MTDIRLATRAPQIELPVEVENFFERPAVPCFAAVSEWYETVGIGVPGGELFDIVDRHIGDPFFGVFLNPRRLIHFDEWVSSPIFKGSDIPLRSGMALRVNFIPASGPDDFTTNIEDGIALADEELREELAGKYPDVWERVCARRRFMSEALGISLKPEVLPFSNILAYLSPFLPKPTQVAIVVGAND